MSLSRRGFLIGSAALAFLPRPGLAASPRLTVASRQIEVLGRAAMVFGITGPDGRPGLLAQEGDRLSGLVRNGSGGDLVLHWHGQTRLTAADDRTRPGGGAQGDGTDEAYDFPLTPGTHWMHAHQLTEQQLLAAPMITREADAGDLPEAVLMLHDFSFRSPEEIFAGLAASPMHDMAGMKMGGMDMGAMKMGAMPAMTHANDVAYDAYLANDRALADPEVVSVAPGRLRLRLINGATATAFWIDAGTLAAQVIAVDGNPVTPLAARGALPLAQGQRLDLLLTIPPQGGAFPILAQVEGMTARTGILLATPGARIDRVSDQAATAAPLVDLGLEARLTARDPLPLRPADQRLHLTLGMDAGYRWTINGAIHGEAPPLRVALGTRVEIMFMNPSMMMHPMHLHGHHFQVVDLGQGRFAGPMRDVVIVPPGGMVTVAVDVTNPGDWFLHCHHLYHMASGMMTTLQVA